MFVAFLYSLSIVDDLYDTQGKLRGLRNGNFMFGDFMLLVNNTSMGDINSMNLPCLTSVFARRYILFSNF